MCKFNTKTEQPFCDYIRTQSPQTITLLLCCQTFRGVDLNFLSLLKPHHIISATQQNNSIMSFDFKYTMYGEFRGLIVGHSLNVLYFHIQIYCKMNFFIVNFDYLINIYYSINILYIFLNIINHQRYSAIYCKVYRCYTIALTKRKFFYCKISFHKKIGMNRICVCILSVHI